jgi:predicted nucleic acid-binding protein
VIVVDTNIVAYFALRGPHAAMADAIFAADADWAAPALWRSEFQNILATFLRRKEFDLKHAVAVFDAAQLTIAGREFVPATKDVLGLAHSSGRSAYDCEFVAVARDLGRPLVTNDRRLRDSFPDIVIPATDFATPNNR